MHWGPVAGANTTIRVFLNKEIRELRRAAGESRECGDRIAGRGALRLARRSRRLWICKAGAWDAGQNPGPGTGERDAVARGRFYIGIIPRRITGES